MRISPPSIVLVGSIGCLAACACFVACSSSNDTPSTSTDAGATDSATTHDAPPGADSAPNDANANDDTGTADTGASDAGADSSIEAGPDGIFSPAFDGDNLALPYVVSCTLNGISAGKDAGVAYPNMQIAWAPSGPSSTPTTYHCQSGLPTATMVFQYQLGDGGVVTYSANGTTGSCDVTFDSAAQGSGGRQQGTFSGTLTAPGSGDKVVTGGTFGCTVP